MAFSERYSSSVILNFMRYRHMRVKHNYSPHAVVSPVGRGQNGAMPKKKAATPPPGAQRFDRKRVFIKEWRKYKDLTQEQVAERAGLDQSTVQRIENGKLPYTEETLERFAFAYGCDVIDILTVNPLAPDPPRLIYDRLRQAPKLKQEQALAILEAFLKAG